MWKTATRTALWSIALILVAVLVVCAIPGIAWADGMPVKDAKNIEYDSLAVAIGAGTSPFTVIGSTPACDIPSGVSVSIESGGSITGSFFNSGSVTGARADNCGTIYDYTGAVTSGNVRVQGPAVAGVSEVRFSDGAEQADYQNGVIWIPKGKIVQYLIINNYVCTPDGGRIQYAITYLYHNAAQSAMKLDAQKYPTAYCVMTVDQTIPAAPDVEVNFVFAGWYCITLGVDETNLQKTITIPANKGANLTLLSWWTESAGHNKDKPGASSGMASGGSGGRGGLTSGISAMADMLTAASEEKDEDEEAAAVLNDFSATQGGGARVRIASAKTRHTFSDTDGDIAMRASLHEKKRFPWQWVGVGLGGALVLFALSATIRRRLCERDKATLEKLNIRE